VPCLWMNSCRLIVLYDLQCAAQLGLTSAACLIEIMLCRVSGFAQGQSTARC
jgi:hypothetical protein